MKQHNVLVLDYGGSSIKYGLIDSSLNLSNTGKVPAPRESLEQFLEVTKSIAEKFGDEIKGIGISLGARMDTNGIVVSSGQFPFLNGLNPASLLSGYLGLKVHAGHDGLCAALAEMRSGNLKNVQNAVMLVLGTGIGGVLIIDGKIVGGAHSAAAELSLVRVNGMRGLENSWMFHGGAQGLVRMGEQKLHRSDLDGKEIFREIDEGNPEAIELLEEYAEITAVQIYNLQAVLDAEVFAIGGGISCQKILIETIRSKLNAIYDAEEKYGTACQRPEITACRYHNDANLIGAYYVFNDSYAEEEK